MKKAWALTKVYISSLYGISGFIDDLKTNKKEAAKKIALVFLILFSLSGTVAMFVFINISLYDAFKSVNQEGLVITNSIIMASLLTLVFGVINVVATYFVDKEGDLILSMPLKPWNILFSKFAVNYITELLIALFIMLTGIIVYGVKSGEGAAFYIVSLIITAFVPVIPLVITYFIMIPIMKAASFMRKKDTAMILGGLVGVVLAIGIQIFMQSFTKIQNNPQYLISKLASQNGLITIAGKAYYPSIWGTYAIIDAFSIKGLLSFLIFAAASFAIVCLLLCSMSNIYIQSILSGSEVKKSTKKLDEKQFEESFKGRSKLSSLFTREFKLMNREPIYFLNGPMIIIIMPVILAVVFFTQKSDMMKAFQDVMLQPNAIFYITLGVAAAGVFLGCSTSITSTCISREGKTFIFIKSMPIEPKQYIDAKLLHGILFGFISSIVSCTFGILLFNLPFINCIAAILISNSIMVPIFIAGIMLELKLPKLQWDNPQKAIKQNTNAVIIIFGQMFILFVLGFMIYKFLKTPPAAYTVLIIFPALISIYLHKLLLNYAEKRFYEIEM